MRLRKFSVLVGVLASLSIQSASFAQSDLEKTLGADGEVLYLDTADELRCPTCAGLSVLGSDAPFSKQIKDLVKEKVQEGMNKEQILTFFTERYGPWILRAPPTEGFHILAWAVPISILALGPLVLWLFVWRRRKPTETHGVRSVEAIVTEMNERLDSLRRTS